MKKKDQISFDEQEAIRLQAEFDEEVRLAREKDEANKLFDKAMKMVSTFVDMNKELVKESSKKVNAEMAQESSSKRAGDELEQEKEVAIDAIPLATKPPSIVDFKILKEGKISYFQIIRADGSLKRPEEDYDRVLWGDLKTMFESHVEDLVWRNLQGNKVLIWKLFNSCGVHFVRFQNLHVFMLVEKK
ncbi:hypothetical protein Tco_0382555 [Tanacetum coccineum]